MDKVDKFQNESASKGNSEDSLLVIYIFQILKKYSSHNNPLSSQDVMGYLKKDYSFGDFDEADPKRKEKAAAQQKKVRRLLDTLYESYWGGCIKKEEGKTRNGHKWFYDVSRDKFAKEEGVALETLSKEEIEFITDIIASSKIINSSSTISIVNKLLKKAKLSKEERIARLRKIKNEEWPKSINKELLLIKKEVQSCIDNVRKMKFDYEDEKSILATPYGWGADDSGKYILIAKVDGEPEGEFSSYSLEKIHNIKKEDFNYSDFDDTYFDRSYGKPDDLSTESLFANIQIITTAIEEKKGIEFKYLSYVIRDSRVVVDGKEKRVLPHRLVFNDGKYYLIGYDEEQAKIDYYRVDLISKVDCSSTKIEVSDWDSRVLSGVQRAREVEKHPLMLSGTDVPVIFKVVESALDRVIDTFGKKADDLEVTDEIRVIYTGDYKPKPFWDHSNVESHEERVVRVKVRTTKEEAFRWALANANVVELVHPQDVRDRIARLADPFYQLYTQSISDKVRENIDYVLKEGTFKISYKIDSDTAYATYKELAKMGNLGVVDNMGIAGEETFDNLDYFGEFFNTERLILHAPQIKELTWAAKLVNVKELKLTGSQCEDVSWMKGMKKLQRIYLSETQISDLSFLSEHKEIDTLDISGTKVSDISFIEDFIKLTQLNIAVCPIEDFSPLFTTKSNLKYLEIDKKSLEKIGEGNIRNRHMGIYIKVTNNSPFWYL